MPHSPTDVSYETSVEILKTMRSLNYSKFQPNKETEIKDAAHLQKRKLIFLDKKE